MKKHFTYTFYCVCVVTSLTMIVAYLSMFFPASPQIQENIPSQEIRMVFGGDVMLSRTVNAKMQAYQDYTWPFTHIASIFSEADIAFVNLESPFLITDQYHIPSGSFGFFANPKAMQGMKLASINVVSLANNHFGDKGIQGMQDTFQILEENGIQYVGAGRQKQQAHAPALFTINDMRIGFLAYAYPEQMYVATEKKPGIAFMNVKQAKEDVKALKEQVDLVIVSMHAGTEYTHTPNWQQKEFAHAVIDAGADFVIGHHPHWVQEVELYHGKYIVYSLGNLIFDQMWSEKTRQGVIMTVVIQNKTIHEIDFIPIKIHDYGQAHVVQDEKERQQILSYLQLPTNHLISD